MNENKIFMKGHLQIEINGETDVSGRQMSKSGTVSGLLTLMTLSHCITNQKTNWTSDAT